MATAEQEALVDDLFPFELAFHNMKSSLYAAALVSGALACAFAVFAMAATSCAPATDNQGTLTVGMELKYPPFEMTDEKGNPTGVSVDMANALGKFLGKTVVIQNTAFDGLIPSLKSGKIDLIISSMTATPERAQSIDFSNPYLKTGLCLLLSKNSDAQTPSDLDAPSRLIAVKQGTTGQLYATRNIKPEHLLVLDDEAACVLEVIQGKADGFIYDQMSVYQHWKRHQDTTRAILKPFQEESWAVGIRTGNKALLEKVNAFLEDFRAKGGFNELGDKYLKEQKDAFKQMDIPFYF